MFKIRDSVYQKQQWDALLLLNIRKDKVNCHTPSWIMSSLVLADLISGFCLFTIINQIRLSPLSARSYT